MTVIGFSVDGFPVDGKSNDGLPPDVICNAIDSKCKATELLAEKFFGLSRLMSSKKCGRYIDCRITKPISALSLVEIKQS